MLDRDAFQLGYLPHLIGAHFEALSIYLEAREGAEGELAKRVEAMPAALQARGPEIVSCVWQVARVCAANGMTVVPEPRTGEDAAALFRATVPASPAPAFVHARRCGLAERAIDLAWRACQLAEVAPVHAQIAARLTASRTALVQLAAEEPATACPTTKSLASAITAIANEVVAGSFDRAALAAAKQRIGELARALETAAWGTPRDAIRGWFAKTVTGNELMRRVAEHPSWSLAGTVTQGDTSVLFAFSDLPARDEKPAFLGDPPYRPVPGPNLLHSLPDGLSGLVLDATADEAATINYQRAQFPKLKEVAREAAFELAACDWSRLDLDALRTQQFWVLVGGGSLRTFGADDGYGRTLPAVYSTPDALDAHLASATQEQRDKLAFEQRYLLPGHALFSTLAQGAAGFVLNPKGPGRSRAFNRRTLEALAAPAQVGPSSATRDT